MRKRYEIAVLSIERIDLLNILSLFDGISCARVAIEKSGVSCDKYYASEIDPYAIKVSLNNYPEIIQVGDVKELSFSDGVLCSKSTSYNTKKIDLICAGSPCQDLSILKKDRLGLNGERSGLFWEFVRILKEVNPTYFILENVNSMSKDNRQCISTELGIEPIMIDASDFSAQKRKRLFWTNIKVSPVLKSKEVFLKDIIDGDFYGLFSDYNNSTVYDKARTIGTGVGISRSATHQQVIIKDVKIKKNSRRGGQKEAIYTITEPNGISHIDSVKPYVRNLSEIECERLQGLPDGYTSCIPKSQRYKCIGNGYNSDVFAYILENMTD